MGCFILLQDQLYQLTVLLFCKYHCLEYPFLRIDKIKNVKVEDYATNNEGEFLTLDGGYACIEHGGAPDRECSLLKMHADMIFNKLRSVAIFFKLRETLDGETFLHIII